MIFFLQVMHQSTMLKYHFLYFWFGLIEYATDQKNSGGSEFYSISTTFGEVGSKFSKNSRSLLSIFQLSSLKIVPAAKKSASKVNNIY